ncbi:MAG: 2-hydroxyacid dehydrogenase [Oscillospiraceae bacterium]|nr:2-hydroxyacid dehydrogenase [Oscillospiraceae bacterium]
MYKIAMFDTKPYDEPAFVSFGEKAGVKFKFFEAKLNADTAKLANGFDGVCVFVNDDVNADVIERLYEAGIRLIVLRCAGFNNVDVKAAFGKIHILRVPAYSPYAVAEHAIAMLLTIVRRTHKAYIRTRDFNFSLKDLAGFDLHGKTVGVVGTGKIGRVFINICNGFGMNVCAYDAFPDKNSGINYVSLDELFEKSDIISLHCPLTPETHHLVNRNTIRKMKKGVIIINTSRGALIDSEALISGIKEKKIGGACLDVYEEESDVFFEDFSFHIVQDDTLARLVSMPNVLITSHQAFLTNEALSNIAETTVKNITDFFDGRTSENEVCYRCERKEECRKGRREKCF